MEKINLHRSGPGFSAKHVVVITLFICLILGKAFAIPFLAENALSGSKIFVDSKKNVYVTGSFSGTARFSKTIVLGSYGGDDIFVAKYDPEGNCIWAMNAGSDAYDEGKSIVADDAGYVYLTGVFEKKALFGQVIVVGNQSSIFVAKLNPSGDPVWIRSGNGKEVSGGYDIRIDKQGNSYVAGNFYKSLTIGGTTIPGVGGSDIALLKFSPKGDLIFGKCYGGRGDDVVSTPGMVMGNDGFFLSGNYNMELKFGSSVLTTNGLADAFIAKFNTAGEPVWAKGIGGKGYDYASGISPDKDGGVYLSGNFDSAFVCGTTQLVSRGGTDFFFGKFDASGKNLWMSSFGTGGTERSTCCVVDGQGFLYVGGSYEHASETYQSLNNNAETFGRDLFLLRFKGSQPDNWNLLAGGNKSDEALDLVSDVTGKVYLLGAYEGSIKVERSSLSISNNGGTELFLAKPDAPAPISFMKNLVGPEPNFDQTKYVNYYARLLHGKEKVSLVDQTVRLKDKNGEILQSTKTDMYGDFSFKGVNSSANVKIVIERDSSSAGHDPVYLASQTGEIKKELAANGDNDITFDILSEELLKLTAVTEEDNTNKLKNFKTSKETEVTITENILYAPGEFNLGPDYVLALNRMVNALKQNPTYKIEVYSHTDATGNASDNITLSERRVKVIVDLFIKKGIKADRIVGKGFGETKIINRCVDGIDCPEVEHQVNRRTEFKFIK